MHALIILPVLSLAAVPVLGQTGITAAPTTTTPPLPPTAAPTTTTPPCSSLLASLERAGPGHHPAVASWLSEQQALRSSAVAATPSLTACAPLGFRIPSSLYPAMSSGQAAQKSWESAHTTEIRSVLSRCEGYLREQQESWLSSASLDWEANLSCRTRTTLPPGRNTTLATTAAASTTTDTASRTTPGGAGGAQSGTPPPPPPSSGAGRVAEMGTVGIVAAAAVFAGLAGLM